MCVDSLTSQLFNDKLEINLPAFKLLAILQGGNEAYVIDAFSGSFEIIILLKSAVVKSNIPF